MENNNSETENTQTKPVTQPTGEATREKTPAIDWEDKFNAQKKVNKDLERKLNEAYKKADKIDDLEQQIATLQGREKEYETAKHEQEVLQNAISQANQRIIKAEIRAAAAGKLNDPADALHYLDTSAISVADDGQVDTSAITSQLNDLIAAKPYLAKGENAPTGVHMQPPSGNRDGDQHKGQLTRDDLKHMTPHQIVEAQKNGQFNDLLGVK